MQRLCACSALYLSALYFSRDFKAILWVQLRRCRSEILLRFLRKTRTLCYQAASDELHQLHPHSEARIPAPLLIAVQSCASLRAERRE